jgi:iron complex transport system substrate-binding protein
VTVRAHRALLGATLAALAAVAALAGCGSDATATPQGEPAPAVTDGSAGAPTPDLPVEAASADGRTVTVTDVDRIVPLVGNLSEVVFSLGLGDNVVGRDISATFPEAADLPLVTEAHDVSAESVLSLRPTLVLADTETGPPEALDHLRNVGVPVLVLEQAESIEDIATRIRTVAAALGVPDAGERLVDRTEAELAAVTDRIPAGADRPSVAFLYLRGQAAVYLIGGPGAGTDSLIEAAGGIDAGTAQGLAEAFTPLTSVAAAPDAILMTTTGLESVGGIAGLLEIPGIAQTPAGRAQRIITVEDGLLFSFGTRTPEALAQIIEQLHS